MFAIAYLLIAANCAICFWLFERKRFANSPFQVLYLLILSVILVPAFADVFAGLISYHPLAAPVFLDADVVLDAHVKIFLLLLCNTLFELSFPTPMINVPQANGRAYSLGLYRYLLATLALSALLGVALFGAEVTSSLSFDALREGPVGLYSLWLYYLQLLLIGLPAYFFFWRRNIPGAIAILALFALLHLVLGGSRQVPAFSLAAILFIWLSKKDRGTSVILLLLFIVGFSAIDMTLEALKLIRNAAGVSARIDTIVDIVSGRADLYLAAQGESGVRYVMYEFMTGSLPQQFGNLEYLLRTLLFWLPSFVDYFGIKPPDFEVNMFERVFGSRIGTVHATIFGSAYADAGILSFLWIVLICTWMRVVEMALNRSTGVELIMLWATCIYSSSMIARGSLYAPILVTAIAVGFATLSRSRATSPSVGRIRRIRRLSE